VTFGIPRNRHLGRGELLAPAQHRIGRTFLLLTAVSMTRQKLPFAGSIGQERCRSFQRLDASARPQIAPWSGKMASSKLLQRARKDGVSDYVAEDRGGVCARKKAIKHRQPTGLHGRLVSFPGGVVELMA
jgi:hypothetical protein